MFSGKTVLLRTTYWLVSLAFQYSCVSVIPTQYKSKDFLRIIFLNKENTSFYIPFKLNFDECSFNRLNIHICLSIHLEIH